MASVTELEARQTEIKARLQEIDAEHAGDQFSDSARQEWNDLNEELDGNEKTINEIHMRMHRRGARADDPARTEPAQMPAVRRDSRGFKRSHVPDDPTNLADYRNLSTSMNDLERGYRDGAMEIVEKSTIDSQSQEHVARMLDTIDRDHGEGGPRALARRIIATSSETYNRAFGKYLAGQARTPEEERTLSLTTTAGGFAVPFVLDPTVIQTSSGVVNPVRQLARVIQITGNHWEGVTSAGITAAYGAEATETTDNAPVLAQPTADVEKAQAFVPFSIEISEDWGALQSEMAMMLADAKDRLEADKFLTGLGHTSTQPEGLLVGSTAVVTSAATAAIGVADIYALESALDPRWRARASFVANRAAYQKVRQFDTQGGANLWVQLQFGSPATLIGYEAYEWSNYSSAVTTTGSTVATIGDFNQFLIVDRVGMNVEMIPHLFGTARIYPTGQRGLYCYWRNTSKVLVGGGVNPAFRHLKLL